MSIHDDLLYKLKKTVPTNYYIFFLYILFTADLPVSSDVLIGTFADDTAALAVDFDPKKASAKVQIT